jgi:surface antigen
MIARRLIPAILIASLIAACSPNMGQKETIGAVGGGIGGAVVGAQMGGGKGQLVAIAAGTLIGVLLGGEVGRQLDSADRAAADNAYQQAQTAPIGQNISWNNPDNGNSGAVTPVRDGTSANGEYCREFQQTVNIGGRNEQAYGVACQQPDGSWRIVQ